MAAADDFGTLIFNHQIAIGMTFGNVQAAWGKPKSVDRSVSSSGVREYWWFPFIVNHKMNDLLREAKETNKYLKYLAETKSGELARHPTPASVPPTPPVPPATPRQIEAATAQEVYRID